MRPRIPVPVFSALAEISSDVDALADVIAWALAADHTQFFSISAEETKGMYKQRIRTAWGHAARRGWARLLLDRRRGLIAHGPWATRCAGGQFDEEEPAAARRPPLPLPWVVPRPRLRMRHAPEAPVSCHTI